MFGQILGAAIRAVTIPVDAVNAAVDIVSGGDGSKRSRNSDGNPVALIEQLRDRVAEAADEIDGER